MYQVEVKDTCEETNRWPESLCFFRMNERRRLILEISRHEDNSEVVDTKIQMRLPIRDDPLADRGSTVTRL